MSAPSHCDIQFKRVRENVPTPQRAHPGDGGFDLTAIHIEETPTQFKVYTGLAMRPERGWVLLLFPRSSISKRGLMLANSIGLIDNGYTGEIVAIFNKLPGYTPISIGERIVQIVPQVSPRVFFEEVLDLEASSRGGGGFGSTGSI